MTILNNPEVMTVYDTVRGHPSGITNREIREITGMDARSVRNAILRLHNRGYIMRPAGCSTYTPTWRPKL